MAIATPPGRGALGIVRLSGQKSHIIAGKILKKPDGDAWPPGNPGNRSSRLIPNHLYLAHVVGANLSQEIDEVMVSFFSGPKSYTGEDMVEIYGHGGPISLQEILKSALLAGATLAKPGEFTRRAFLNGKISLSQAEAVGDLISARTSRASQTAWRQLAGDHDKWIRALSHRLEQILGSIAAELEFPDEVPRSSTIKLTKDLEAICRDLGSAITAAKPAVLLKQGIRVVIIGRANVGKSTLFNAILGLDRAITSPWPGTTRDFIEETYEQAGLPVTLIDTAGWKGRPGPLDSLGWRKSRQALATADLVILVLDASSGFKAEDRKFWELAGKGGQRMIVALNKIDRGSKVSSRSLPKIGPAPLALIKVSALRKKGLADVKQMIGRLIPTATGSSANAPIFSSSRHLDCLQQALRNLKESLEDLKQKRPLDIVSLGIDQAWVSLGEMTGERASEKLLDSIFSRFCLGK